MKQVECQHCDTVFRNNERDPMLMEMLGHYNQEHPDVMSSLTNEIKAAWMREFERRWHEG